MLIHREFFVCFDIRGLLSMYRLECPAQYDVTPWPMKKV